MTFGLNGGMITGTKEILYGVLPAGGMPNRLVRVVK
jgi:hypothetical protein